MTFNGTSWGTAKAYLTAAPARILVLLVQEHHLVGQAAAEASAWARSHGWKSLFTDAVSTEAGGTSGGTAIFVREQCEFARLQGAASHQLSALVGSRLARSSYLGSRHSVRLLSTCTPARA